MKTKYLLLFTLLIFGTSKVIHSSVISFQQTDPNQKQIISYIRPQNLRYTTPKHIQNSTEIVYFATYIESNGKLNYVRDNDAFFTRASSHKDSISGRTSIKFRGAGSKVNCRGGLLKSWDEFTIDFWVNLDSWEGALFHRGGDDNNYMQLLLSNEDGGNRLIFKMVKGGDNKHAGIDNHQLSLGAWHHVVLTYKGSNDYYEQVKIYIDGVNVHSDNLWYNSNNGKIHRKTPDVAGDFLLGTGINGKMDEIRVFDKAVSDTDVLKLSSTNFYEPNKGPFLYTPPTNFPHFGSVVAAWPVRATDVDYLEEYSGLKRRLKIIRSFMSSNQKLTIGLLLGGGGWNMLANSTKRAIGVADIKRYLDRYNFDGISLDFEWPTSSSDWNGVNSFIKELDDAIPNKIIGHSLHTYLFNLDCCRTIPRETMEALDYITVQSYDHGQKGEANYNKFVSDMQVFIDKGFDKSKIIMGVPFYGYNADGNQWGYGGLYEHRTGNDGYAYVNGKTYYFDNVDMIKRKTRVAIEKGIGGMMMWSLGIDLDYDHPESLLRAMITTIEETVASFTYGGYDFLGVTTRDYDGDGIDEIAIYSDNNSGTENLIVIFEADGTYIREWTFGGHHYKGITSGDYDGDGTDEIAIYSDNNSGTENLIVIFEADGTYVREWTFGGHHYKGITSGDYDGDGTDEIAIYSNNSHGTENLIVVFKSNGTYIREWTFGGYDYKGITSGNFNNDSTDEIAVYRQGSSGDNRVYIFNATNGTYIREWDGFDGFSGITAGDYDRDGIDELAFYKYSAPYYTTKNRIIIFEANGTYIKDWDYGNFDIKGITSKNLDDNAKYKVITIARNKIMLHDYTSPNKLPLIGLASNKGTNSGGVDIYAITLPENDPFVVDINATDPNKDTLLSYSLAGHDSNFFEISDTGNLRFKNEYIPDFENPLNGDGSPNTDGDQNYWTIVTVTNTYGLSNSIEIRVAISNANETPSVEPLIVVEEGRKIEKIITCNYCGENPAFSLTLYDDSTAPDWITISDDNKIIARPPTNLIEMSETGFRFFKLAISTTGKTPNATKGETELFTVVVAPDGSFNPTQTIAEDTKGIYDILSYYASELGGINLQLIHNYTNISHPNWVSFTSKGIRVIPGNSEVGTHTIPFKIIGLPGNKLKGNIKLTVTNVNDVPIVSERRPVVKLLKDMKCDKLSSDIVETFDLSTIFSDIDDGDNLTYSIMPNGLVRNVRTHKPDFVELSDSTLIFTFTSGDNNYRGIYQVGVKATDSNGESITSVITIFVGSYTRNNNTGLIAMTACTLEIGITLSDTSLSIDESNRGGTGYYTITLNKQPTNNVFISITSNDVDVVTVHPNIVRFSIFQWKSPQLVLVNAVVDADLITEKTTISHSISSRTSASEYLNLTLDNIVKVTVNDYRGANSISRSLKKIRVNSDKSASIKLGGFAVSIGEKIIREKGIIYSTSADNVESLIIGGQGVYIETITNDGGNYFSKKLRGLTTDVTYYYRAYTTDNDGTTAYGDVKDFIIKTNTTSGNKDFERTGISISPNPTAGILNIIAAEKTDYKLLNIRGQTLKTGVLSKGESEINLSYFAKGIYLLNLKTNKESFTKKIVKN